MAKPNIDAVIQVGTDGAYYEVKLQTVPQKGELIDLFSFRDTQSGHESAHFFEVLNVVHEIHDVTEKAPVRDGVHGVKLIVRDAGRRAT